MKARIALAAAAVSMFAASAAMAAPEVELTILGGQATFEDSSFDADESASADWAPGVRGGIRLGESPVLLTLGARHSDALDTSYDAGVRLNQMDSNLGLELRAVRFEESDVRDAFGDRDVEAEAAVTYDLFKYLRLGAGVTTATLDDSDVNGLVTADLVFTFGGPKPTVALPKLPEIPVFKKPAAPEAPMVEQTGERG